MGTPYNYNRRPVVFQPTKEMVELYFKHEEKNKKKLKQKIVTASKPGLRVSVIVHKTQIIIGTIFSSSKKTGLEKHT